MSEESVKGRKTKLLVIIHSLEVGGAEGQVYELVKGLNKARYEPVVCSLTDGGKYIDRLRAEGIRVFVVARRLRYMPWKFFRLVRLLRKEKFDIVQNVMFTASVIGTLVARACRVPIVINCIRSLGFLHYAYRRPIKRIVYKISDCVVANSKETKSLLIERGIVQQNKILTIYNGVNIEHFQPSADPGAVVEGKSRIALSAGDYPIIGIIASLSRVKNHDCLLKAAPQILREFPRAAFLIIGGGALEKVLKKTAESLGIDRHVFFWAKEQMLPSCCE